MACYIYISHGLKIKRTDLTFNSITTLVDLLHLPRHLAFTKEYLFVVCSLVPVAEEDYGGTYLYRYDLNGQLSATLINGGDFLNEEVTESLINGEVCILLHDRHSLPCDPGVSGGHGNTKVRPADLCAVRERPVQLFLECK